MAENLGVSTDDLLIGLGDLTGFGSLKKQIKQLDKVTVVEEVPASVLARAERKQNYEASVDILNMVNRQVSFNRRSQQVDFVQEELDKKGATLTPSVTALAASFKPRTELEMELKTAMDLTRSKVTSESNDFMDPKIKQANEQRQLSRLRTLLHAELERNKRIKKIKSRTYRKIHRKSENLEREKLLTRLETENPELAKTLRDDFERKLAKLRLQRHKQARVKWARVAQRFGGKDMQKEVTRQAQDETDEKRELVRAVKGKRKRVDSSDFEDNSGDESDSSADAVEAAVSDISKVLADSSNASQLPADGIFGLSFMRKGVARKRVEADEEARNLLSELQQDHAAAVSDLPEPAAELNEAAVARAANDIKHLVNLQTFDLSAMPAPVEEAANPWLTTTAGLAPAAPPKSKKTKKAKKVDIVEVPAPEEEDEADEDLFNKFGGSELDDTQKQLIKQLFASSDTHEMNFSTEAKKEAAAAAQTEALPGWGRWAGPGVTKRSKRGGVKVHKQPVSSKVVKEAPKRLVVSDKVQADKYAAKAVPYPFANADEFSAVNTALTAPELMTMAAHAKTVAPKINVRVGAVIAPLDTSKRLTHKERDVLLEAWNNRKKPSRTRAKF